MTDEAMSPLRRRMIEDMTICKIRAEEPTRLRAKTGGSLNWGAACNSAASVIPLSKCKSTSNVISFVISSESRGGSGLHGSPGFVASWRPIYQNRSAVKVVGSPFKTFTGRTGLRNDAGISDTKALATNGFAVTRGC
jgi:hypothetical protein